ncbi:MAG: phospholipase D-like domain-containing protein [Opitutaceae bacterium]
MRTLLVGLLVTWLAPLVWAQGSGGITVRFEPTQVQLRKGEKTQVRVTVLIDVGTTPAPAPGGRPIPGEGGDPRFTIGGFLSGELTVAPDSPFKPDPNQVTSFVVPRGAPGSTRTRAEIRYVYTIDADRAQSGEELIRVEGGQGINLLGVREQGLPTYRGLGRLMLLAIPGGARANAPAARPPFQATEQSVNPPQDVVDRVKILVALLGPIALINWVVTRPRGPRDRKDEDKKKPEPKKRPEPPPLPKQEEEPSVGCKLVVVVGREEVRADGKSFLKLQLNAIPPAGCVAEFVGPTRWTAKIGGSGRSTPDLNGQLVRGNTDASSYQFVETDQDPGTFPAVTSGTAFPEHWKVKLPWEWGDVTLEFTATAKVKVSKAGGSTGKTHSGLTAQTGSITVIGANPEFILEARPGVVQATGRESAELNTEGFRLFYEPAPKETFRFVSLSAKSGEALKPKFFDAPEWSVVKTKAGKPCWTPPFLLQEPGYGESIELDARFEWRGGEYFQQAIAGGASQPFPLFRGQCEVTLLGCDIESKLEGKDFLAIAGTALEGKIRVVDSHGKGVDDPFGKSAVHGGGARMTCDLRDLSQGKPSRPAPHGCTIPPRHPFDVDVDPSTLAPAMGGLREKKIRDVIDDPSTGRSIPAPRLRVTTQGYVIAGDQKPSKGEQPLIQFWKYESRVGEDPIHDGPVVVRVTVEDGFGGKVEARDAWFGQLGSVVLETGGVDFRIYEHRPFSFDASCDLQLPDALQDLSMRWEFALVDKDGTPVREAGSVTIPVDRSLAKGERGLKSSLVVGHLSSQRDYYLYQGQPLTPPRDGANAAKPGEVVSFPLGHFGSNDDLQRRAGGWRAVEIADRSRSTTLRHRWHALQKGLSPSERIFVEERERGMAILGSKDTTEWTDTALFVGVRVELRDRDGHLLAVSDRLAPWGLAAGGVTQAGRGGRTPSDRVWRDHLFRYVLLALRLRLRDETGQPYDRRPVRLAFDTGQAVDAKTGAQGEVEILVAPSESGAEIDEVKMIVLSRDQRPTGAELALQLGHLERADTVSGVQARLNNLGLFAGRAVSAKIDATDACLGRALARFQTRWYLEPTGRLDKETQQALEEAHDESGRYGRTGGARQRVVPFVKPDGDPVAYERKQAPDWEDPSRPAPMDFLVKREALVSLDYPNTLFLPGDPPTTGDQGLKWFTTGGEPAMNPVRHGNDVRYLIDANETYREMVKVMREAKGPDDYIYLLGWCLYPWFELIPGDPTSTIEHVFREAAGSFETVSEELETARRTADQAERAAEHAVEEQAKAAQVAMSRLIAAVTKAGQSTGYCKISGHLRSARDAHETLSRSEAAALTGRQTDGRAWTPGWREAAVEDARKAKGYAAQAVAKELHALVIGIVKFTSDSEADQYVKQAYEGLDAVKKSATEGDSLGAATVAEDAALAAGYFYVAEVLEAAKKVERSFEGEWRGSAERRKTILDDAADVARAAAAKAEEIAAQLKVAMDDERARRHFSEAKERTAEAQAMAKELEHYAADPGGQDVLAAAQAAVEVVQTLADATEAMKINLREMNRQWDGTETAPPSHDPGILEPVALPSLLWAKKLETEIDGQKVPVLTAATLEALTKEVIETADRAKSKAHLEAQRQAVALARKVGESLPRILRWTEGRQVQVRGIFWQHTMPDLHIWPLSKLPHGYQSLFGDQYFALRRIESFPHASVVQENKTASSTGTHHQKVIVVKHGAEVTAFCGGLDINPDRLYSILPGSPNENGDTMGAPFHDVHCRIDGPAAFDILQIFIQRWSHAKLHGLVNTRKEPLRAVEVPNPPERPGARHLVQVGRTFGKPTILGMLVPEFQSAPYEFARNGERTAWNLIRHAISQAERFIYVEDQYIMSRDASSLLYQTLATKPTIEHLTILIPRDEHTACENWQGPLRRDFLAPLLKSFPEKVRVFTLEQTETRNPDGTIHRPKDWHTYVHNKMWIIDDKFLIVGSANCNQRSYTNDSEIMSGIYDPSTDKTCSHRLAHQLRIALWAEHLNMTTPEGYAELSDGVASAVHWLKPPAGARVARYEPSTDGYPMNFLANYWQAEPTGSDPGKRPNPIIDVEVRAWKQ